MKEYIATFYTHHGAMVTENALKKEKIECKIMPPPREISSSCTSCVFYKSECDMKDFIDSDFESIYEVKENKKFILIFENN